MRFFLRQQPRERPLFFEAGGVSLFGVLNSPPDRRLLGGVVWCGALAEEGLCARRVYANAARQLCEAGWAVLRADVRGEGDSDGDFQDSDFDTRVLDIAGAVTRLEREVPAEMPLVLIGHRTGGHVAADAASRIGKRISGLVVWDPIYSGKEYFMRLLRNNVAAQLANEGRVTKSRREIVAELTQEGFVVIDGYVYRGRLVEQLMALDLEATLAQQTLPTLVLEVSQLHSDSVSINLQALLTRCTSLTGQSVAEKIFWKDTSSYITQASNLTRSTLDWLRRGH